MGGYELTSHKPKRDASGGAALPNIPPFNDDECVPARICGDPRPGELGTPPSCDTYSTFSVQAR